jgi:hypothetical protein
MQLGEIYLSISLFEDSKFEPETHPISSSSLTKCISTAQKAPFRRPKREEKRRFNRPQTDNYL